MKAIALISGGLDSILAARVAKEEGIEIVPLYFKTPFCHRLKKSPSPLLMAKENLGLELETVDISGDFLELLENPRYGFGSNMNPCIDCKILMLKKAKELMRDYAADFIVTGEVLGQRPMSQHRKALELIEEKSGLEGLLLRPLSSKLMPKTEAEKEGKLSEGSLLAFNGRSRRPQIALAQRFKIKDYPNASGGCLLTDPEFSARLKELITHHELNLDNIELLKFGRHFRLSQSAKLVVSRDEQEGGMLEKLAKEDDCLFSPDEETAGPLSLGRGKFSRQLIEFSCMITCRYFDLNGERQAKVMIKSRQGSIPSSLRVSPAGEKELQEARV